MLHDICENSVIHVVSTCISVTGPAVHEDNESFQFQNVILRYVYCLWQ